MRTPGPFYEPAGESLRATDWTRGPWSLGHQHGGPPAGLLVRAAEATVAGEPFRLVRLTVEFPRPVPIATLDVATEVVRSGRTVREVASVLTAGGAVVARGRALLIREGPVDLPADTPVPADEPPPGPAASEAFEFPFFCHPVGYQAAMEVRLAAGRGGAGPTSAWFRMGGPLVAGEEPSPAVRVAVAVDSGHGVAPALDPARWLFVNPDLTLVLLRPPVGQWVGLDAAMAAGRDGIGMAECRLRDPGGPIGRSIQSLVIAPREESPR